MREYPLNGSSSCSPHCLTDFPADDADVFPLPLLNDDEEEETDFFPPCIPAASWVTPCLLPFLSAGGP